MDSSECSDCAPFRKKPGGMHAAGSCWAMRPPNDRGRLRSERLTHASVSSERPTLCLPTPPFHLAPSPQHPVAPALQQHRRSDGKAFFCRPPPQPVHVLSSTIVLKTGSAAGHGLPAATGRLHLTEPSLHLLAELLLELLLLMFLLSGSAVNSFCCQFIGCCNSKSWFSCSCCCSWIRSSACSFPAAGRAAAADAEA